VCFIDTNIHWLQGLEKYLMTKIYHKSFAVSAMDKERDEALSTRMQALNFIEPQHLDIPPCFRDEKSWLLAMKELHKINSYKVRCPPPSPPPWGRTRVCFVVSGTFPWPRRGLGRKNRSVGSGAGHDRAADFL